LGSRAAAEPGEVFVIHAVSYRAGDGLVWEFWVRCIIMERVIHGEMRRKQVNQPTLDSQFRRKNKRSNNCGELFDHENPTNRKKGKIYHILIIIDLRITQNMETRKW
jgi:hypothetical protein